MDWKLLKVLIYNIQFMMLIVIKISSALLVIMKQNLLIKLILLK